MAEQDFWQYVKYCNSYSLSEGIHALAFSLDGTLLVAADATGRVVAFDCLIRPHRHVFLLPPGVTALSLVWRPNLGLFCGLSNGKVALVQYELEPKRVSRRISVFQLVPP